MFVRISKPKLLALLPLFLTHVLSADLEPRAPVQLKALIMRPVPAAAPPPLAVSKSDLSSVHVSSTFNFFLGGLPTPVIKIHKTSSGISPGSPDPKLEPTSSPVALPPTSIMWVPYSKGDKSEFAVIGGIDLGRKLYVARSTNVGNLIPGKICDGLPNIFYASQGRELMSTNYEVLVAPPGALSWVKVEGKSIPENAIVGGHEANGDFLYIGRASYDNTVTTGKVDPRGVALIPYGGQALFFENYEILVLNSYGRALMPDYQFPSSAAPPTTTPLYFPWTPNSTTSTAPTTTPSVDINTTAPVPETGGSW